MTDHCARPAAPINDTGWNRGPQVPKMINIGFTQWIVVLEWKVMCNGFRKAGARIESELSCVLVYLFVYNDCFVLLHDNIKTFFVCEVNHIRLVQYVRGIIFLYCVKQ